jgi:hypothetical protein
MQVTDPDGYVLMVAQIEVEDTEGQEAAVSPVQVRLSPCHAGVLDDDP